MSVTTAQLQTQLAYRLGEKQAPGDLSELARRLSFLNDGLRAVYKEQYYWFTETQGSDTTVASQETYTLPSTVRDLIEVRINRKLVVPQNKPDAMGSYNYPPLYYQYSSLASKWFITGDKTLHIHPIPSEAPTAVLVTAITVTGTTAVVTCSTEHGFTGLDFVTIAGTSNFNGTQQILSVPSTTTFTFTSSQATETGTFSATLRNLTYRYYSEFVALVNDSDTTQIPDGYTYGLVNFAYARKMQTKGRRGSAADGFDEFREFLSELNAEQNRRTYFGKNVGPTLPEYVIGN